MAPARHVYPSTDALPFPVLFHLVQPSQSDLFLPWIRVIVGQFLKPQPETRQDRVMLPSLYWYVGPRRHLIDEMPRRFGGSGMPS